MVDNYWHVKTGKKPANIPADRSKRYKKEWKGWGDWLGSGYIATSNRVYRPFEEARAFVHTLGLKDSEDWSNYIKSGQKPEDIPASPSSYRTEFKGMGDWLGTGVISTHDRLHRPFEEAREFVRTLGLENREEWMQYCKSGRKPQDIPYTPDKVYENEWTWWADWLGYKEEHWSVRKVKELLKHLIESKIIYQWDEAVLYSFLLRKGLLHLHNSCHEIF